MAGAHEVVVGNETKSVSIYTYVYIYLVGCLDPMAQTEIEWSENFLLRSFSMQINQRPNERWK